MEEEEDGKKLFLRAYKPESSIIQVGLITIPSVPSSSDRQRTAVVKRSDDMML